MTEKRHIFHENNLVSTTECTGAAPRAMDVEAAETIAALTAMPCSPTITAAAQARNSLPGGNAHPSDTHNPQKTTPACHPAKGCSRYHRAEGHNP